MSSRCVAFVVSGHDNYGVRRGTIGLMAELRARGHAPFAIALEMGDAAREIMELGFDVNEVGLGKPPTLAGSPAAKIGRAFSLRRFTREARPRIGASLRERGAEAVHVRWPNLVPVAAAAAHTEGLPTLWHMPNIVSDNLPFGLNRRLWRRLCLTKRVVPLANSRYTASTLDGGGIRCEVLYVPIAAERFDPERVEPVTRSEVGLPEDAVVAGVLSRVTPSKGQDRLVEAVGLGGGALARVHLAVIGGPGSPGDEAYVARIRRRIDELGLHDRVHLLGFVPDPERYYGLLDFSINARVDPEPFGLSVTESMAMGVPVLAHALGGPAETVVDGKTGWHVSDPSPGSFATGLERALNDRERWGLMGEAARRRAVEQFTMGPLTDRYESILEASLTGA
ncbi:MAG: glycosyltransferase family 4 protein [Planctomycetota bacterium]